MVNFEADNLGEKPPPTDGVSSDAESASFFNDLIPENSSSQALIDHAKELWDLPVCLVEDLRKVAIRTAGIRRAEVEILECRNPQDQDTYLRELPDDYRPDVIRFFSRSLTLSPPERELVLQASREAFRMACDAVAVTEDVLNKGRYEGVYKSAEDLVAHFAKSSVSRDAKLQLDPSEPL